MWHSENYCNVVINKKAVRESTYVRCTDWFQDDRVQFNNVPLEDSGQKKKKQKVPRRILHFSDGVLEEYSTDEEEEKEPEAPVIDPVCYMFVVQYEATFQSCVATWLYILGHHTEQLNVSVIDVSTEYNPETRMHSSRTRTTHSLTVSRSNM